MSSKIRRAFHEPEATLREHLAHGLSLVVSCLNANHTIGMQVEEVWIYEGNREVTLQPGMVLNLEMYAQHETGELIGDEETYVITETGCRQLTHLPTAIRTVTR